MKTNNNILTDEMSKKLPFEVPENYFNEFAHQMDKQIGYNKTIFQKIIRPWMYVAAIFVGIVIMGQLFYTVNQNITARNAQNYESYVLSQVDENSVADLYVDESTK